jgi:hypothetical protein
MDCRHRFVETSTVAIFVNICFTVANIFHLIYLGMPFDGSDGQEYGYDWRHTLAVWSRWSYFSHLFAALIFLVGFIL